MNVIVGNKQQNLLSNLDIDIIKSITGTYSASELIQIFKNFFYNKMILDITALKDYTDINTYKTLATNLDQDKVIYFVPEKSPLCTAGFFSALVSIGIYNFTTNTEGIKYLVKHSNTLQDVKEFQKVKAVENDINVNETKPDLVTVSSPSNTGERRIIGVKSITGCAGSTTFIYMLKRELERISNTSVIAVEVDKFDFRAFGDKNMYSSSDEQLKLFLDKNNSAKVILVDLNNSKNEFLCNEIIYLLEPSMIKINKLLKYGPTVLKKLQNKKVVLNKSLLTSQDVLDFEYESGLRIFYNMPPLNERRHNDIINDFLSKMGLINSKSKSNSGRVFGLFRR